MSGVHVHILVDQDHEFDVSVQPCSTGSGALARVDVIGKGRTWVGVQSSDPTALRNLAGALLDAASKADDLIRRRQKADDERVAIDAEAQAEPGYDLDPAEVSS